MLVATAASAMPCLPSFLPSSGRARFGRTGFNVQRVASGWLTVWPEEEEEAWWAKCSD